MKTEFNLNEEHETVSGHKLKVIGLFVERDDVYRVYYKSETKSEGLIDANGLYFMSDSILANTLTKLK